MLPIAFLLFAEQIRTFTENYNQLQTFWIFWQKTTKICVMYTPTKIPY